MPENIRLNTNFSRYSNKAKRYYFSIWNTDREDWDRSCDFNVYLHESFSPQIDALVQYDNPKRIVSVSSGWEYSEICDNGLTKILDIMKEVGPKYFFVDDSSSSRWDGYNLTFSNAKEKLKYYFEDLIAEDLDNGMKIIFKLATRRIG